MLKSQKRIDELRKKMEELEATKAPTQDYKDVTRQIADAEKKQAALNDRMEKFLELGGNTKSKTFRSMQYDAAELENTIAYAKGELQDLIDTGKAFTLGTDTAEYSNLSQQLAEEQARLNDLASTYSQTQEQMESASRTEAIVSGFRRVGDAVSKGFSSILKYAGKAGTAIKSVGSKVAGMAAGAISGFKNIGKGAESSAGKIGKLGTRILSLAKTVFIWRVLRSALDGIRSAVTESFGTYLDYDSSLKSSITSLKSSLATLQGSFASAFAPIISIVVPYISTLVNWLITAVNAVAAFIAALTGQSSYKRAVASVSGVGDAASDAAGSLGDATNAAKELNKELGKYDDLNVIGDQDKSSGSGGSGGGGGGGASGGGLTYEDVEIESSISDMADKIKEAWANADFTEIGNILGEKLRDGLLSIPWDGIQKAAQKVGKSVATLINGFVETAGLGDAIGMTVAEAINTGILGVESFATNLHWDSVGQFIADGINGALTRVKWENAINASSAIGSGIASALNKVITPETFGNIGSTVANAVNTVLAGAYSFVGTVNWSGWGSSIASAINRFFNTLDWEKAGLTLSNAAIGILDALKNAIVGIDWSGAGASIATALKKIEWKQVLSSVGDVISSALSGLVDFSAALFKGLTQSDFDVYLENIDNAIIKMGESNDEIEQRITNAGNWKTAGEGEAQIAERLAEDYFDLAEKQNKTKEEKEALKEMAKQLVQTLPELEKYYNSETGLLDTTRTSVDNLIESLKAKARTEAAQESLKSYYSAQMDAKKVMDESKETAEKLAGQEQNLARKYDDSMTALKNLNYQYATGQISEEEYAKKAVELANASDGCGVKLAEVRAEQEKNNTVFKEAKEKYDAAGDGIEEITGYLAAYSLEADNAGTKTDDLKKKFSDLSKESQITISIKGMDASTSEKISVIAEVTGTDYSRMPVSEKFIDDCYAEIINAYAKDGVMVSAPFKASSMSNDGKSVMAPFNASTLSNNGKNVIAPFNASVLSNNGKTVTAPVKASGISDNGKTVTAAVKAKSLTASGKKLNTKLNVTSIANTPTMKTKINVVGQANTPTISAKVKAVDNIWARNSAKGGVYSGSAWSNLPQFAAGGIINLAGKIARFASGGIPNHGTVFVAGEAGSEIVGNIGGRTEILNKSQLASVMYSAVLDGMLTAVNGLAQAINACTIECTNTAILNLGYILENLRAINASLGVPQVAIAGMPYSMAVPDTNKIAQTYNYQSSGSVGIDINALADAVAKRVNVRIDIENVMTMDGQPVYRKMVEIDSQTYRQTGRGGFEH